MKLLPGAYKGTRRRRREHEAFQQLQAEHTELVALAQQYPIIAKAVAEGWAEVKFDHQTGHLGVNFHTRKSPVQIGDSAVEKLARRDGFGE